MIVKKATDVPAQPMAKEGVKGVSVRWLMGPDSGAPHFYTRLFEVEPGGHSPRHVHDWEHEVYVLEGAAKLHAAGGSHSLEAGSFALILPGEEHQFENDGNTTFKFLCIIPKHGQ